MKAGIERLVDLSVAEGNAFDRAAHAEDAKLYEMAGPMSPAVREAGERDPALAYAQTMGEPTPREGFIDEANDMLVMFPFPPEIVAAARAEARGTTWQTGFAMIAVAIGAAELWRGLFHGGIDTIRIGVGLLFLIGAVILFRDGRARMPVDRG